MNYKVLALLCLIMVTAFIMLLLMAFGETESESEVDSTGCLQDNEFDFIVVGSGSTGGIVAARLSESAFRVLLLEAGGEPLPGSEIPLLGVDYLWSSMDWSYTTAPQEHCCGGLRNRRAAMNRGKAMGGTSSLNFLAYTRGNKRDYNRWKELGNDGWGYDDVFPYFLKSEDYRIPGNTEEYKKFHSHGGPLSVERPSFVTPVGKVFVKAGIEMGYKEVDFNGEQQIGFQNIPVNIKDGTRCSTYRCYVMPAMKRKNLVVIKEALVTKVLVDGYNAAVGVEYSHNNSICTAKSKLEVILSAGVIGSPHILMLSGIGPKATLDKFQIPVVKDLPGVGQNFHDHVTYATFYQMYKKGTYNYFRYATDENLKLWRENNTGPLTCPSAFEGIAFFASKYSEDPEWPDHEIYFTSDNILRYYKNLISFPLYFGIPSNEADAVTPVLLLLRPKSRGEVTLKSADPFDDPIIDPRYLSHPDDMKVMIEGIKNIERLMHTDAMKQFEPSYLVECPWFFCDLFRDWYYQFAAQTFTSSGYHPAGSCKMAPSDDVMGVVDNKLRVRGISRLRVADASIMPEVVAAHPSVTCMMIGEKLADELKKMYEGAETEKRIKEELEQLLKTRSEDAESGNDCNERLNVIKNEIGDTTEDCNGEANVIEPMTDSKYKVMMESQGSNDLSEISKPLTG